MSQENVEIIRRMYDAFARRDTQAPYENFAPDITWDISRGSLEDLGVYRGHEGVRDHLREVLGSFTDIAFDVKDLRDVGDHVLATVDEHYVGRTSGIEVDRRHYAVYTLRGGRLTALCMYLDHAEALEAVGLSE